MKNKHFYSHLVGVDDLVGDLDVLELTAGEKKELLELAHLNLHSTIVDAILSELSERDKKIFLGLLASEDHDKLWKHLNEKVEKIEDKIQTVAKDLKGQLREDIKKVK